MRFYRDNKGIEVDAIVEAKDGRWVGIEVKLRTHRVGERAAHLPALRDKLDDDARARGGKLPVGVADSPVYARPEGAMVSSVAALGP